MQSDAHDYKVLYIHGFASSPQSHKALRLEKFLAEKGWKNALLRPQIPVSPLKAIDLLKDLYSRYKLWAVFGSSLGGFYALYMSMFFPVKTILLNPALKPSADLADYIGLVKRHYSDEFFYWLPEHVEQLRRLEQEFKPERTNAQNLVFHLAKDDEILDHSQIPLLFPNAQIYFYDNCGHACTRFDEILQKTF